MMSRKVSAVFICVAMVLALKSTGSDALQFWKKADPTTSNTEPSSADSSSTMTKEGKQSNNDGTILVYSSDFFDPFMHWDVRPFSSLLSPFSYPSSYRHSLMNRHLLNPFSDWIFDRYHDLAHQMLDAYQSPDQSSLMKPYSSLFTTDLIEKEQDYRLTMDLPGIDLKDIAISVEEVKKTGQHLLTITAERKKEVETEVPLADRLEAAPTSAEGEKKKEQAAVEVTGEGQSTVTASDQEKKTEATAPTDEKKSNKWIKQERLYGKMQRQLVLPENVNLEEIKSQYVNGVLTITLPKLPAAPEKPTKRQITIESA